MIIFFIYYHLINTSFTCANAVVQFTSAEPYIQAGKHFRTSDCWLGRFVYVWQNAYLHILGEVLEICNYLIFAISIR